MTSRRKQVWRETKEKGTMNRTLRSWEVNIEARPNLGDDAQGRGVRLDGDIEAWRP
jgi:hypothetical protein